MARNARSPEFTPDLSINRIVEGTRIEGEILCESNIRIDGVFVGILRTAGRLVIGPKGQVQGQVTCADCELEGRLEGDITVTKLLSLKAKSRLEGDVAYGQFSVEPGAEVVGTCRLVTVAPPKQQPAQKPGHQNAAQQKPSEKLKTTT
jgi:cytoskeletal protein CcmA (bactofilin family)